MTGAFARVAPSGGELLKRQFEKLHANPHANLLHVDEFKEISALSYYRCEYLEGPTLRQAMNANVVGLQTVIDLALAMDSMENSNFGSHGDLKPDNTILTSSGIKLIDPGYFGNLSDNGHASNWVAITTPEYYPLLQPDDLFAFGVIAWEALVGTHPLFANRYSRRIGDKQVDETLLAKIAMRESTGNHFSSGLLELQNPNRFNSDIPWSLGILLLKLLRLRTSESGKLAEDHGFGTFGSIAKALLAFKPSDDSEHGNPGSTQFEMARSIGSSNSEVPTLENQFSIMGDFLSPGRKLHIVALTEAWGFGFLRLRMKDTVLGSTYLVEHILQIDGASYCLLGGDSDDFVNEMFVFEICGDASLETISTKRLELLRGKIVDLIRGRDRQDFEAVEDFLMLFEPGTSTHNN